MPINPFSSVQLTLLSVTVALILENLLNQLGAITADWSTALPWLQAGVVAVTVLTIWSGFALILSVSTRQPSAVDFIYPFGLLIALTLAANSVGEDKLVQFFLFLALGGVFATWALFAEIDPDMEGGNLGGIRRAIQLQALDAGICLVTGLALLLVNPATALVLGAMVVVILVQGVAAYGTMQGWRFVTSANYLNSSLGEDQPPQPEQGPTDS